MIIFVIFRRWFAKNLHDRLHVNNFFILKLTVQFGLVHYSGKFKFMKKSFRLKKSWFLPVFDTTNNVKVHQISKAVFRYTAFQWTLNHELFEDWRTWGDGWSSTRSTVRDKPREKTRWRTCSGGSWIFQIRLCKLQKRGGKLTRIRILPMSSNFSKIQSFNNCEISVWRGAVNVFGCRLSQIKRIII